MPRCEIRPSVLTALVAAALALFAGCGPVPDGPAPVVAGDNDVADPPAGQASVDPPQLDFTPGVDALTFDVLFNGGFGVDYQVESAPAWLTVTPASGAIVGGRASLQAVADRAVAGLGLFGGDVVLRVAGQRLSVSVALVSLADDATAGGLLVTPGQFRFGLTATTQVLLLYYQGDGEVAYTVSSDRDWLSVDPAQGVNRGALDRVLVHVDRARLPAGEHTARLTLRADSGEIVEIPASVRVAAPVAGGGGSGGGDDDPGETPSPEDPTWLLAPAALDFDLLATELPLQLRRSADVAADFTLQADAPWVSIAPAAGTVGAAIRTITVAVDRAGLMPGEYGATLTVRSGQNLLFAVPLRMVVPDTVQIAGRIVLPGGIGVAGVRVRATDADATAHTDADGAYRLSVPFGWTGAVLPESDQYVFDPPNHVFFEVVAAQSDGEFVARPPATGAPSVLMIWGPGDGAVYQGLSDADANAQFTQRYLGNGLWQITIRNLRDDPIDYIMAPWQVQPAPLGDRRDDFLYTPRLLGEVIRNDVLGNYAWRGTVYPGVPCSPAIVVADRTRSRVVAAANWPPVECTPLYSLDRQSIRFDANVPGGTLQTLTILVAEFHGAEDDGLPPWAMALDPYVAWLQDRMTAAGRYPIPFSDALRAAHGWWNIQLQNSPVFQPDDILTRWARWKDKLPWIQFWGQMSNYSGEPELAVPPLEPNEPAGCCLGIPVLHPRYAAEMPRVVDRIRADGGLVGFYARPRGGNSIYPVLDSPEIVDGVNAYQWFENWVRSNEVDHGTNAFYIDVLGARYLGPPSALFPVYDNILRPNTVIEHMIDFAPTGFLASGGLNGGALEGGPGKTRDLLDADHPATTFPPFVRYLLADRPIFLGQSNNDFEFWGSQNDHWTERQVFLLGCKFDAINPDETYLPDAPPNAMLLEVIAERDRVDWWGREPQYRDTRGVTGVPPSIDVRRFTDRDGVDLFAIDNPAQLVGRTFRFHGRDVPIPAARISIVEFSP